jgi:salicylate hydroxylase
VHRADLQAALQDQVNDNPGIELRLGCQFEDVATDTAGVIVTQRSGTTLSRQHALALIGADGVWSAVRQRLFPHIQPQFSGLIAWRGTFEATQSPSELASKRVQLWMGSNAHLVTYQIAAGRGINVVAIVPGTWKGRGSSGDGDPAEIRNAFSAARWPEPARRMIGAVDGWRKWALFTVSSGADWSSGPIALLGDAAHAMLPFAAQGAGMAIEDAAVLAKCLADGEDNATAIAAALKHYSALRRGPVARRNGKIYHLGGVAALVRDSAIRSLGARRMLARQEWIYRWRM